MVPVIHNQSRRTSNLVGLGCRPPNQAGTGQRSAFGIRLNGLQHNLWCDSAESPSATGTETAFPMLLAYCGTVTKLLWETKRADLIDRYVRPMASGECFGGFA